MKLWRSRRHREADVALERWRLLGKQAAKDMQFAQKEWQRIHEQLRSDR